MLASLAAIRSLSPNVRAYVLVWAPAAFGYFGVSQVLNNLYLLRLGFDAQFVGLLTGAGTAVWALSALPAAILSRRFGSRAMMIAGFVVSAIGLVPGLLVELAPREAWPLVLFAGTMTSWFGGALNSVSGPPLLMSLTTPEERPQAFVLQPAISAITSFAGSLVAGALPAVLAGALGVGLDSPAPFRIGLALTPLSYLVAAALSYRIKPHGGTQDAAAASLADVPTAGAPISALLFLGVVIMLQAAGDGAARTFFNIYLDRGLGVDTASIGALMGVAQLLPVFAALIGPRLLRRLGADRVFMLGDVTTVAGLLPLALIASPLAAAAGFLGVMIANSVLGPAKNLFGQQVVHPRWRATASAASTIGLALGWTAAAALGGAVINLVGFRGLYLTSSALALLSALLLWLRGRRAAAGTPAVRPAASR